MRRSRVLLASTPNTFCVTLNDIEGSPKRSMRPDFQSGENLLLVLIAEIPAHSSRILHLREQSKRVPAAQL